MIEEVSFQQNVDTKRDKLSSFLSLKVETILLFLGLIVFRILCDESYLITKLVFNYENPFNYEPTNFSI